MVKPSSRRIEIGNLTRGELQMAVQRGVFISFEGSEGCGKTTQIRLLRERMEALGRRVEQFREPGATALGERIRQLLQFTPEVADMCPQAELLLFAASRAQLVRECISPALESGRDVIADRFLDSTTVYQGIARGLRLEQVAAVNELAVGAVEPQLTIVLDMDSAAAFERVADRDGPVDRMEQESTEFYESVRSGYLEVASREPARIRVVDASAPVEQVAEVVWDHAGTLFEGVGGN